MSRVRTCGVCLQPVRDCLCDPDDDDDGQDSGDGDGDAT